MNSILNENVANIRNRLRMDIIRLLVRVLLGGKMYINQQTRVNINGIPQFLSIRAEHESVPLLLYLHGGPGDAALPSIGPKI